MTAADRGTDRHENFDGIIHGNPQRLWREIEHLRRHRWEREAAERSGRESFAVV